ncbi:MAG: Threonine synthase [Thermotogales bacterium 46_20]|nr:MAG: Threonine synthase [Thermotogales bacterium 46_20]
MKISLVCSVCGASFSANEPLWRCECGGLLDVVHHPEFPIDRIMSRPQNMWRYREAIPLPLDSEIVSFDEGHTPLLDMRHNGVSFLTKLDFLFPTGSFKDRGASVLVSKAKSIGISGVIEDSSGNAGASLAAYCARACIRCKIFVPHSTSESKLEQISAFGAQLVRVRGSREDTAVQALKEAEAAYYASHSWNPFFIHGTKTVAYEICEQLKWNAPSAVVVPVGNGTLLLGVFIGFQEMCRAGLIKSIPRLVGVRSASFAPVANAWHGENIVAQFPESTTVAEGIAVERPVRSDQILNALKSTNGWLCLVSDDEIREAMRYLACNGILVEPTGAVSVAGFVKDTPRLMKERQVVVILTGSGLKDMAKVSRLLK